MPTGKQREALNVVLGKIGIFEVREVIDSGAGDRGRTGDVQLGKLAFYH